MAFFSEQGINAAIEAARFTAQVCSGGARAQHERYSSQTILFSGSEQYVVTLLEKA